MLPLILCAGVGREWVVLGEVEGFAGSSWEVYVDGLCGVLGWPDDISVEGRVSRGFVEGGNKGFAVS